MAESPLHDFGLDIEQDQAIQQYIRLHTRQQSISRRLSCSSSSSSSSTTSSSPPISPASYFPSHSNHHALPISLAPRPTASSRSERSVSMAQSSRGRTMPLSCLKRVPDIASEEEEEPDLLDLVNTIKATLTSLLNMPLIKLESQRVLRTWVQGRLMEAEQDLKILRKKQCRCSRRGSLDDR